MAIWGQSKTLKCLVTSLCVFLAVNSKAQNSSDPLSDTNRCGAAWAAVLVSIEGKAKVKLVGTEDWADAPIETVFCTGDRITVTESRAALRLANDTLVRLDANTSLSFLPQEKSFWLQLWDGVAHFITRTPKSFEVKTGALNAAVNGTEFLVSIENDETRVLVIEGEVVASNDLGAVNLTSKQQAVATASQVPLKSTVVSLVNSVAWTLHFPPLSFPSSQDNVIAAIKTGLIEEAYALLVAKQSKNLDDLALEAALALHLGRVQRAQEIIDSTNNQQSTNLNIVRAFMSLVYGETETAHEQALRLTSEHPNNPAAWQLLAYTQQAKFELNAALKSAQVAEGLAPNDGVIQARLAELSLSLNKTSKALKYAANAQVFAPKYSRSHTIMGFAQLNRRNISAAKKAFERAYELNSADPQAALGLGLVSVRKGNLVAGREYLELAVGLDPTNALLRSTLGKLYYEINRNDFAHEQFELAKEFDPNDPTPWFYNSLREQDNNNPVSALEELQIAQEKNDNRAVYRSRLLLDSDEAARGASLGNIYRELGFDQLALREGTKAIEQAPNEYAGHRLVAESYIDDPFNQSVRTSEALQARIHQPIGTAPLPIGLGETGLLVRKGAGPTDLGLNEYNPLFIQEGFNGRTSAVVGTQDTHAFEASLYGNTSNFGMHAGIYSYETDGFRENNDADYEIRTIGAQYAINDTAQFFIDYTQRESDAGDLRTNFDPEQFSVDARFVEDRKRLNIGTRFSLGNKVQVLGSYGEEDREVDFSFPAGPFNFGFISDSVERNAEIFFISELDEIKLTGGYQHIDNKIDRFIFLAGNSNDDWDFRSITLNAETQFEAINLNIQAGTSFVDIMGDQIADSPFGMPDEVKLTILNKNKFLNKIGLKWDPTSYLSFRTMYLENINAIEGGTTTLKPTHNFGFLNHFDETQGLESKNLGAAFDFTKGSFQFGIEYQNRNLDTPIVVSGNSFDSEVRVIPVDQNLSKFYFNSNFSKTISYSSAIFKDKYERDPGDIFFANFPRSLDNLVSPQQLTVRLWRTISTKTRLNYIRQKLVSPGENEEQSSSFFTFDLEFTHKLENRSGSISFAILNTFDKTFNYQDTNFFGLLNRRQAIVPERAISSKINLMF